MSAPKCAACGGDRPMCNLSSVTKGQQAIRELAGVMRDRTGNLPLMPGIYPDYRAPVVRNQPEGRELTMARWGMPSPPGALKGRNADSGVTNIRDRKSTRLNSSHANISYAVFCLKKKKKKISK